jgi:hypothetical protein
VIWARAYFKDIIKKDLRRRLAEFYEYLPLFQATQSGESGGVAATQESDLGAA